MSSLTLTLKRVAMFGFAIVVAVVTIGGAHLHASSFSVDTTLVTLPVGTRSALVRLTNTSDHAIRFDIKSFAWDHDPQGVFTLLATKDVVTLPALVILQPNQSRALRVGTTINPAAAERAYRLIIEELPDPPKAGAGGATVAMRMKLSIPVFLAPLAGTATMAVTTPTVSNQRVNASITNTGSVHMLAEAVTFKGTDASGRTTFERTEGGGYVLAGRVITPGTDLTTAECRATTALSVTVKANGTDVVHDGTVPSGACQ